MAPAPRGSDPISRYRTFLIEYAKDHLGVSVAHPFARDPDVAVFKHANNRWFGIIMDVSNEKLKIPTPGTTEVLNVKLDPVLIGILIQNKGYRPAYHMNKKHWVSVLLDGSVPKGMLVEHLMQSYELTRR